jgi:hypothetical protein
MDNGLSYIANILHTFRLPHLGTGSCMGHSSIGHLPAQVLYLCFSDCVLEKVHRMYVSSNHTLPWYWFILKPRLLCTAYHFLIGIQAILTLGL